jgi:hypothetical protein
MPQSLDEFFAGRDWPALEAAAGWTVTRDPQDNVRIVLVVSARDGESYRVLFLCDGYPDVAPSVAFVNEHGSKADPSAWPRGSGAFFDEVKPPPSSFLCMPLTREGLHHHPDWARSAAGAWNPDAHTLMDLFNRMQRLLNSDQYEGRGR